MLTLWCSNATSRYLFIINKNVWPHKYLYWNAYSNLANSENWKQLEYPSAGERINYLHTMEYYLASKREWILDTYNGVDKHQIILLHERK